MTEARARELKLGDRAAYDSGSHCAFTPQKIGCAIG